MVECQEVYEYGLEHVPSDEGWEDLLVELREGGSNQNWHCSAVEGCDGDAAEGVENTTKKEVGSSSSG